MNDFYTVLKGAHSGWRYIVFVLLIIAVLQALMAVSGKRPYTEGNRKLNLFTLISAHIQLLLGLILYFVGSFYQMDSSTVVGRYWKMEHISMMLLAIVLITVGNSRSKKVPDDSAKHKAILVFFGLALLLIIGAIFMMTKSDPTRHWFGMS